MEWFLIISLVLAGLLLLVVEILFIPGSTLIGILGIIVMVAGVALSFNYFGTETGWLVTAMCTLITGLVLFLSFRSNFWRRFSLRSSIDSTAHESIEGAVVEGETGTTTSALRPVGNAEFAGRIYEVKTLGGYLDVGKKVRVVRVKENQIFVEPLK
jgi:membrane-bound ClpP family serine protease